MKLLGRWNWYLAAWLRWIPDPHVEHEIVAARRPGLDDFGLMTVMAAAGFFQTLLDLTVEESPTKYAFRYVAAQDWGRLRRLFSRALQVKPLAARSRWLPSRRWHRWPTDLR